MAGSDGRLSEFRVYYEDTDFSGVVYHANTLKFFERARTDALRALGVTHSALLARAEPLVFAVRRMRIDWRAPARIDDVVAVETRFLAAKGARVTLRQAMRRGETALADADVEIATMTLEGRPRRLPDDLAAAFLGAPAH
ncbi:MAG: tol-pal system-associated acyl-CoA thioesterase [Pseudomonadota bacterium]